MVSVRVNDLLRFLKVSDFIVKGNAIYITSLIITKDNVRFLEDLFRSYLTIEVYNFYIEDLFLIRDMIKLRVINLFVVGEAVLLNDLNIITKNIVIKPTKPLKINTNIYTSDIIRMNNSIVGRTNLTSSLVEITKSKLNKTVVECTNLYVNDCVGSIFIKNLKLNKLTVSGNELEVFNILKEVNELYLPSEEYKDKYFKNVKCKKLIYAKK